MFNISFHRNTLRTPYKDNLMMSKKGSNLLDGLVSCNIVFFIVVNILA